MSDLWDDHRGFGRGWLRSRAVGRLGLAVLLNHPCGVPIVVESLGDVPLLSIPVWYRRTDPVCSGEKHSGHYDLVRQGVVRVEIQIPVHMGLLPEHRSGQGAIGMTVNPGNRERSVTSTSVPMVDSLDGQLNRI